MSESDGLIPDMNDGPHRTLPLSTAWRRVAERVDDDNYDSDEVRRAVRRALEEDWQADIGDFGVRILNILREPQPDLYTTVATQINDLRVEAEEKWPRKFEQHVKV